MSGAVYVVERGEVGPGCGSVVGVGETHEVAEGIALSQKTHFGPWREVEEDRRWESGGEYVEITAWDVLR